MTLGPALLFCPGDRPDRFAKAAAASDVVILDLEDAVAPEAKQSARDAVAASTLDPATTIVRVNPTAVDPEGHDLAALRGSGFRTVMLPKAETAHDVARWHGFQVVALCETPLGVRNAELLAGQAPVIGLTWGAEDLVAALGGTSSRAADGSYREYARYARSRVLIAGASEGKPVYDTVHLDIEDDAGLAAEAEDAAASGFAGTLCIHPRQVPIVRTAFRPSPERLDWARRVLAYAAGTDAGVFAFEGRMIDQPLLRQAAQVVESAERAESSAALGPADPE